VGAFALVLATTQWWGWEAAMRQGLDTDVGSYQQIARAAPQLPSQDLPQQHAERFAAHWLVGVLSNESMLHAAYYVAAILALAAIVAVFHVHAARTGAALNAYLPALLVLVASPYLFRLDALGPGLVADAVFALGLAGLVAGLAARDDATALAALAVASAARQTAVPVGLVAAAVVLLRSRRAGRAAAFALVPLAIYGVEHAVAASFSKPVPGAWEISVLADPGGVRPVAKHVLLIVLPLLPALALLAGGSLRHGVPREAVVPIALAAAVVVQPLLLSPSWLNQNEQRLASLSLPALAAAALATLRCVDLTALRCAVVSAAIFAASFHHLTAIGPQTRAVYGALVVAGSAVIAVATATGARAASPPAARGAAPAHRSGPVGRQSPLARNQAVRASRRGRRWSP
jgi:hypothetical protein